MFFFRLFHLFKYAKPEKYSKIYTSSSILAEDVLNSLQRWRRETPEVTTLHFNRMNEENQYAVEDADEPNEGNALVV